MDMGDGTFKPLDDVTREALFGVTKQAERNSTFPRVFAADLLDARAEVATLREQLAKVCEAATATQRAFEEQAECAACDDKAESMGGRVDPLCDVCMERWAVSHDRLDDAIAAARKGEGE